ncbi:hypothetical protein GALMADRAFT_270886 [Galerina marginata CBS 339.88]|uniref:Uncharacterized protein n=1 Tax=Galerina marginata (strain CBS 339.88) TaxID=685588 RepID=A0A067SLH5_GALM3|nr:hypothetical protein GALMADRAFT_270886 [Galerina marginata CBS 339.88]
MFESSSSAPKSPKLLPITATFLLTLASYLGSLSTFALRASRLAANIANLPLLPNLAHFIGTASTTEPRYMRLKVVSAIVQQFDVRIEQAVFFITQVTTLRRQNTHDIASYSHRYTNSGIVSSETRERRSQCSPSRSSVEAFVCDCLLKPSLRRDRSSGRSLVDYSAIVAAEGRFGEIR